MTRPTGPLPVLHAVTDDAVAGHPDFAARARAVMAAGRARVAVHLRAPRMNTRSLFILAEVLAEAQRTTGAWLVVNDRVDVALAAGARGVQLPTRGLSVADARALAAGRLTLGASVHSVDDARAAATAGADWLLAGHVYATPSHAGATPRGEGFVREVAALAATLPAPVPVVGIGGIRPDHVAGLRAAGASGIAVIRGLWEADDVSAVVGEYLSAHDGHDHSRPADHGQR